MTEKLNEIKKQLLQREGIKVVQYSDTSFGVFRKNKLTQKTEEIAWIRLEKGKIAIVCSKTERKLAENLGFASLHNNTSDHIAGYIVESTGTDTVYENISSDTTTATKQLSQQSILTSNNKKKT